MHSPIHWFFRLKVQCYLKALFWTFEAAFEKPVSMWYQTFRQKSIKRAPQEKSFDRFRNLLIILSRLCYTFIHSMSLRKYDCFWTTQLYQNLMVSCYFFASYYWIFKVRRHLFKCEVWVIKLRMRFYSILVVDLYIVCYNKL